jgi:hypothetical protein
LGKISQGVRLRPQTVLKIDEMSYEEWYEKNEEELHIMFAETGMDRELDFNVEDEIEKEYLKYING